MRITRDDFIAEIKNCTRSLDQRKLVALTQDLLEEVYDKEIVQDADWRSTCSRARRKWKWMKLPPCGFFMDRFDEVKLDTKKNRVYTSTPCDICGMEGHVACLDDKDRECTIGCTCGNRPASEKNTYMMLKKPERAWSFRGKFVFDKEWTPPQQRHATIEEWKQPEEEECPW